jgi:hypothetical protein
VTVERKQALRALKTFAKEIRHLVEAEEDGHRFFSTATPFFLYWREWKSFWLKTTQAWIKC